MKALVAVGFAVVTVLVSVLAWQNHAAAARRQAEAAHKLELQKAACEAKASEADAATLETFRGHADAGLGTPEELAASAHQGRFNQCMLTGSTN
jgi:hypothetical protein